MPTKRSRPAHRSPKKRSPVEIPTAHRRTADRLFEVLAGALDRYPAPAAADVAAFLLARVLHRYEHTRT